MTKAFADAFYWVALVSPRDAFSSVVAFHFRKAERSQLITTEEVLVELLAHFSANPWLRREAALLAQGLFQDPRIQVRPQSHCSFVAGLEFYIARSDKGYSLTDCISMQTMRREGLTDVLTNDRHFEQEGFRAVFR